MIEIILSAIGGLVVISLIISHESRKKDILGKKYRRGWIH